MITAIIPTHNAASTLAACLESLVPAAVEGLVREVLIVDDGSTDKTLPIAEGAGADVVLSCGVRALALITGSQRARFPWLLFLKANCSLQPGWEREAAQFIDRVETHRAPPAAAVFRYEVDDQGVAPRASETLTNGAARLLGIAHAEQGLLIQRSLYTAVGGFKPMPVLEDIDLTRRIGRKRLVRLRSAALSHRCPDRAIGYGASAIRHAGCVVLYALNVPVDHIARVHGTAAA
jgi:glycosyltransferase involved in cell wall biosynthesis